MTDKIILCVGKNSNNGKYYSDKKTNVLISTIRKYRVKNWLKIKSDIIVEILPKNRRFTDCVGIE